MLLMVEKGIRGGIYDIIHQYLTANNKYMKDYNENKEFPYLMYLDGNNIPKFTYRWFMQILNLSLKKLDIRIV